MVNYVLCAGSSDIFDPAVGAGAFFRAAKRFGEKRGRTIRLLGREIHANALSEARDAGLRSSDLNGVLLKDFLLDPPTVHHAAIVANPPYIRHHRIPASTKAVLKEYTSSVIGRPLDGRAGLHVFFLIRALMLLKPAGRLAFILPADTCEGVFARPLWGWITRRFRLDAVITFGPDAAPFPGVDTNALVFLIANESPQDEFTWARCDARSAELAAWVERGVKPITSSGIASIRRSVKAAAVTGLSRPASNLSSDHLRLRDVAKVVRGIATGANDFFHMTRARARELGIPEKYFVRAIGRTRDVNGDDITPAMVRALDDSGRPTFLLSLGGLAATHYPSAVQRYLRQGEALGLPSRSLIAARKYWYRMESRVPPAFFFSYLGRRNCRFIRNRAGVVPLTGFLCVYPHFTDEARLSALWMLLNHPKVIENLALVGKSYGGGAVKVEPRGLEQLPIPRELFDPELLELICEPEQMALI